MVSTAPDAEKMRDARAGLAQEIDRQITYALHMLGESGVEATGAVEVPPVAQGRARGYIGEVCSDFSDKMKRWAATRLRGERWGFFSLSTCGSVAMTYMRRRTPGIPSVP